MPHKSNVKSGITFRNDPQITKRNTKTVISSKGITQTSESDYYERCKKSETIVIEKVSSKENWKK